MAGLLATPASCLRRAEEIGLATSEVIGRLLGERPLDRLRTALGILKLAHKFSPRRLEAACARAVLFDDLTYGTLKRILDRGLDQSPPPAAPMPASAPTLSNGEGREEERSGDVGEAVGGGSDKSASVNPGPR